MLRTTIKIYKGRRAMSINRSKLAYFKAHGWSDVPAVQASEPEKAPAEDSINQPRKRGFLTR